MIALLLIASVLPFAINAQLVGNPVAANLDKTDANVKFGFDELIKSQNLAATAVSWELTKATTQVVAGNLYTFTYTLKIGTTEKTCVVQVWARPWLDGDDAMQISGVPSCQDSAMLMSRQLAGGIVPANINDAEIMAAFTFATTAFNDQSNDLYMRTNTNHDDVSVTKQVVSGMKYVFSNVEMAATCMKNTQDVASCLTPDNSDVKTCSFTVWYQSWMTPKYQLMPVNCQ